MDTAVITEAFVVTVVGGMGSVPGAFLAALIIGQLQAFGILVFPKITLVLVFLLMAAVLVVKPWGLLGKPAAAAGRRAMPEGILRPRAPRSPRTRLLAALAVAAVLAIPLIGDSYTTKVAIEVMVFALAAFSLHFLMGGGRARLLRPCRLFRHGRLCGGAAGDRAAEAPDGAALLLAPIAAGAGAALFGFFVVRLSGIYLAMLTLAFAQIVYAVCFQWVEVTGGDNGVVGVWPSAWASSREVVLLRGGGPAPSPPSCSCAA